jgi:hypothetical protein
VDFAGSGPEKKETASAEVSSLRMDNGQCEAGGHGSVYGIASGLHHVYAGAGGKFVDTGDDRVRGVRGPERGRCKSCGEDGRERAKGK